MPAPTIADLRSDMPAREYAMLTESGESAAEAALRKAKLWVLSRYRFAGRTADEVNWDDEIVREATLERAKYELYAGIENEEPAKDKKENARELIEGILGDLDRFKAGDSASGESVLGRPAAAVVAGSKPTWLTNFEGRTRP